MDKIPSFELFKKTFTNGIGKPDWTFRRDYGNMSFEEAYPLYVERVKKIFETRDKIRKFESYLRDLRVEEVQSNISESRYYRYNGIKYRFSAHVHPIGSMTSETCVDFAADPHLIHEIEF